VSEFDSLLPVPKGDPVALQHAAGKLRMLAGDSGLSKLGQGFRAEGENMAGSWRSPEAAAQATAQVSRLAGNSADYAERLEIATLVLRTFAERLAAAQAAARSLQQRAGQAEQEAKAEANRLGDPQAFRPLFTVALNQLLQEHQSMVSGLDQAAKSCAIGLENAIPGYQPGMKPGVAAAAAKAAVAQRTGFTHADRLIERGGRGSNGLQPPVAGNDPKLNAAWWKELTEEERAKIIATAHREVGSLGGLPAAARSQANELSLAEDLSSSDPAVRNNAEKTKLQLERVRQQLDPNTQQPVTAQLLVWEPGRFNGDGRAAISYGDVDTAKNVMVSVPGITTSVDTMSNRIDDAHNLYGEVRKSPSAQTAAVVAWMGYNAPSSGTLGPVNLAHETAGSADAIEGARLLTDDVNGLKAARVDDPAHLTLIGHSYGSVAVGMATANAGLTADDIVLVGSPGSNMPRASDLTAGPGHVWAGANSLDPVSYTNYWVTDPASLNYGAVRFNAEGPNTGMLYHTGYYDAGSESVKNIARISTGDYGTVQRVPPRNYWPLR
jgi:Alpha/beta hydrolase